MPAQEKTLVITKWPDGRLQVLGPIDDPKLAYEMLRYAWACVDSLTFKDQDAAANEVPADASPGIRPEVAAALTTGLSNGTGT